MDGVFSLEALLWVKLFRQHRYLCSERLQGREEDKRRKYSKGERKKEWGYKNIRNDCLRYRQSCKTKNK
jgi:hypothetical protein